MTGSALYRARRVLEEFDARVRSRANLIEAKKGAGLMTSLWRVEMRGDAREVYEVLAETLDEAVERIRGGQIEPIVSEVDLDDSVRLLAVEEA